MSSWGRGKGEGQETSPNPANANQGTSTNLGSNRFPKFDGDFCLFWQEWKEVVATIQQGKIPELDGPSYRMLHAGLLEQMRSFREETEGRPRAGLQRLEDLLQPWLSLETLAMTDPQTLTNLLDKAGTLERELHIPLRHRGFPAKLAAFFVLLLAGAIAGFFFLPLR